MALKDRCDVASIWHIGLRRCPCPVPLINMGIGFGGSTSGNNQCSNDSTNSDNNKNGEFFNTFNSQFKAILVLFPTKTTQYIGFRARYLG